MVKHQSGKFTGYRKWFLFATFSATATNFIIIPFLSGFSKLWFNSPFFLPLGEIGDSRDLFQIATNDSTNNGASTYPNDDTLRYDQVYVWDFPSNISAFEDNMYHQWWRWRNGPKRMPDGLSMDSEYHLRYQIGQVTKSHPHLTLIEMNLNCEEAMRESAIGTGGFVKAIYLLRLAVAGSYSAGAPSSEAFDIQLSCTDKNLTEASTKLVLPWISGRFSSKTTQSILNEYWAQSDYQNIQYQFNCRKGNWENSTLEWMLPFIQDDLRWMAVKLVGLPKDDSTHPAHAWYQQQQNNSVPFPNKIKSASTARITHVMDKHVPVHPREIPLSPLVPNVELDDVTIHFRCGDIMAAIGSNFAARRFLKYEAYARHIDNSSRSIGIIAQPVGDIGKGDKYNWTVQARPRDQDDPFRVSLCQTVLEGFAEYLSDQFPKARVSIRNATSETVALASARLVMARQAFSSADSLFPLFPVLASFGVGYHLFPTPRQDGSKKLKKMRNEFLLRLATALGQINTQRGTGAGNFGFMYVDSHEMLYADTTTKMRLADETKAFGDIAQWFRDDDFVVAQ